MGTNAQQCAPQVGAKELVMFVNTQSVATQQAKELKQQILSAAMRGQRYILKSWIERQIPLKGEEKAKAVNAVIAYAQSQDVEVK
jgi:deoxyribose-phosphate aldolase